MDQERIDADERDCALERPATTAAASSMHDVCYSLAKRAFDIAFSACVVAVLFVPGLVLCLLVWRDTGGSPLYVQRRVGMRGRDFDIFKFRTMVADADDVEKYLDEAQLAQWHAERKVEDDPRITPLGSFLRKTSIDEFPQFINVLAGKMAIVGPRAITREELDAWSTESEKDELLSVPVGITGLWQTGPRNEYDFESGKRQELELSYVRSASLGLDAKLFFRTFGVMADGTGR